MTYPMHPFRLHHPRTAAEAVELRRQYPNALYVAGGTDLVVNLRRRIREPGHLISLRALDDLRGIQANSSGITIGSGVTLSEIAANPDVRSRLPVLAEAAGLVAGPTLRNMATLGGNIMLDTRCRYYNQSYFWRQANDFCLKKDGDVCHVAPGGSFCWAAFSADTPPVLLLLNAELDIAGPEGSRKVHLRGFYGKDGRWPLGTEPGGLKPGELIVSVRIPSPPADWRGVYEKLRVRDSIDFPLVGAALAVQPGAAKGRIEHFSLALTAVYPQPVLVPGTETLAGRELDLAAVEDLKRLANRTAKPMRTTVADPAYRRAMIGALIEKAAARLAPHLAPMLAERARLG